MADTVTHREDAYRHLCYRLAARLWMALAQRNQTPEWLAQESEIPLREVRRWLRGDPAQNNSLFSIFAMFWALGYELNFGLEGLVLEAKEADHG